MSSGAGSAVSSDSCASEESDEGYSLTAPQAGTSHPDANGKPSFRRLLAIAGKFTRSGTECGESTLWFQDN